MDSNTLGKPNDDISREALEWNLRGNGKRGRLEIKWRRFVEREIKEEGKNWGEVKWLALNPVLWSSFVAAQRPPREPRKATDGINSVRMKIYFFTAACSARPRSKSICTYHHHFLL